MNPELTKLIEQYLAGELSAGDAKAFEDRIASNETLRDAVTEQKEIHAGAKRAYQRQQIENIGKRYHFRKNLLKGGLSLLIIGAIAAASLFAYNYIGNDIPVLTEEVKAKLDEQAPMDLDAQYFLIPKEGGVVLSEDGVLISVPKGAFQLNGKPYKDAVAVQFQEAIDPVDIMQAGLSTTSNGELLETGGMVSVTGYTVDGEPLDFNPKVGVYVQVPMNDERTDMQLFDGVIQADGSINWVKPEPLEKIPVPVPMSELDFYPVGYESYLNDQKWKKSKSSRDSLYLSFEEDGCDDRLLMGKRIFEKTCATCHHPTKDGTGPALAGVRDLFWKNGVGDDGLIAWVRDWREAATSNTFLESRTYLKASAMTVFGNQYSDEQILSIFDYIECEAHTANPCVPKQGPQQSQGQRAQVNSNPAALDNESNAVFRFADNRSNLGAEIFMVQDDSVAAAADAASEMYTPGYIYPSNVLAFWNKGFNNTNLATREFENRMRVIHETCENSVLKVYTSNLDKSLKECDEQLVAMGYSEFKKFAGENVGKLNAGNPHVKQLQNFYDKSIKQLKRRNSTLQELESKRRSKHDAKTKRSREDEVKRTQWREQQAFKEEYNYNLKSVYKQFGMTRGFTITNASLSKVEKHVARSAIKNIDRLVEEATRSRSSLSVSRNGKTAKITYNDFSFQVANSKEYDKLFAYIMPYGLNSYQRIEGKNGKFSYPLNDAFGYNVAVVGVKENDFGFYKELNIKKGNLGTIRLETVSKKKLDANVKQLNSNRYVRPMNITEELEWLYQEQIDFKEQKMRKEMTVFRNEIRSIIFPCCGDCMNEFGADVELEGEEGNEEEPDFGLE